MGTGPRVSRLRNTSTRSWDDMAVRVVFLRSKSPAAIEPRLEKETGTLARAGYDIHAILWDRQMVHRVEEDRGGIRIHRYRRRAPEGQRELAFLLPRWWCHAFWRAVGLKPDVVHAIDLDTAFAGYLSAKVLGARFVYEIFDFYAEMVLADLPPALRRLLARVERRVIARADLVILPDRRREAQFAGVQPRRLVEIMNVPEDRAVRAEPSSGFTVFYGGMISRDRGLKELVATCEATGARFLVAGHGPDVAELLPFIESSPACMYLGTISYEEVLQRTATCQVVAALYDPAIPNNRYAAPNKLFEAMMFSKPVLVSEGTTAAAVVRETDSGLVVPYGDRQALRRALERLMLSPAECDAMGTRGRAAFEKGYNWKAMEHRLLEAYKSLGTQ